MYDDLYYFEDFERVWIGIGCDVIFGFCLVFVIIFFFVVVVDEWRIWFWGYLGFEGNVLWI